MTTQPQTPSRPPVHAADTRGPAVPSRLAKPLAIIAAALILAGILRHFVVQPEWMGNTCEVASPPLWCYGRLAIIMGFVWGLFGKVALALALLALLGRPRRLALPLATTGAALGAAGCFLYDPNLGAGALVLGLIALAREAAVPQA